MLHNITSEDIRSAIARLQNWVSSIVTTTTLLLMVLLLLPQPPIRMESVRRLLELEEEHATMSVALANA